MQISPLLPEDTIQHLFALLLEEQKEENILGMLKDLRLEEQVHILRFLYNKAEPKCIPSIYRVWRLLIPLEHRLNTEKTRRALQEIGQWWDAFGLQGDMTVQQYDELEQLLDDLGATTEGKGFFKWVALYPVGIEHGNIWDEDRRGAIICLGKYAYNKETEIFLAHHLDDWNTIQVEVVHILAAMKSRLLARLAPWYMKNDDLLEPILKEYF